MFFPFCFEDGLCLHVGQITRQPGNLHTHFESLRVNSYLTVWFVVEQSIPEYQREVCVNVQSIFVAILFNPSLNIV
jgi:hypothetical protein